MVYIALLRGINVGGKNIVKMAELKLLMESIGLQKVQTYIQSGNVVFESDKDESSLQTELELKIQERFTVFSPVILRTLPQLEQLINDCPLSKEEIANANACSAFESLYVALFSQLPTKEKIEKLKTFSNAKEQLRIGKREMYLLFNESVRNSKLAVLVQKADAHTTTRNWNTLTHILTLAKEY